MMRRSFFVRLLVALRNGCTKKMREDSDRAGTRAQWLFALLIISDMALIGYCIFPHIFDNWHQDCLKGNDQ